MPCIQCLPKVKHLPSIFLDSNSTTMATHIFMLSLHLNLSVVLALLTNWHTVSHNHHTSSALTPWCPLTLPRGYLNRSMLIWCIWGILIARCSHQTNLLHLLPLSRLLSMVSLAFGYLHLKNVYKLILPTQRWASYTTSSLIPPKLILPLSTQWTTTSGYLYANHWYSFKMECYSIRNQFAVGCPTLASNSSLKKSTTSFSLLFNQIQVVDIWMPTILSTISIQGTMAWNVLLYQAHV